MNTRPFTDAHAIARLEFAIIYRDTFDSGFIDKLRPFLVEELADFDLATDSDDNAVLAFEKRDEEGEITEEVHVHGNYIHAVWSDYRGWTLSRDGSASKLSQIIEFGRKLGLPAAHIGLAYRDVFFNDEPASYTPHDVFRSDCRFLPQASFSLGKKWRTSFSWPESNVEDLVNVLSTLGVEARLRAFDEAESATTTHVTEIVHKQQIRPLKESAKQDWTRELLILAWDIAHFRNVNLMRELLTVGMLEKVGLKGSRK